MTTISNSNISYYLDWEKLFTDGALVFGTAEQALDFVRKEIGDIDKSYIDAVFGQGRNGVRHRSLLRVISGHFDVSSMQHAHAKVISSNEPVVLIEIKCTPSMKAEVSFTKTPISSWLT
jgi:hypothetical protein